jgi:hypothetical protein
MQKMKDEIISIEPNPSRHDHPAVIQHVANIIDEYNKENIQDSINR